MPSSDEREIQEEEVTTETPRRAGEDTLDSVARTLYKRVQRIPGWG
jgi:hypothetical protein